MMLLQLYLICTLQTGKEFRYNYVSFSQVKINVFSSLVRPFCTRRRLLVLIVEGSGCKSSVVADLSLDLMMFMFENILHTHKLQKELSSSTCL